MPDGMVERLPENVRSPLNSLTGRALPTYRLLHQRYGERFVPQDMVNLEALPSGILGGLRLDLDRVVTAP